MLVVCQGKSRLGSDAHVGACVHLVGAYAHTPLLLQPTQSCCSPAGVCGAHQVLRQQAAAGCELHAQHAFLRACRGDAGERVACAAAGRCRNDTRLKCHEKHATPRPAFTT